MNKTNYLIRFSEHEGCENIEPFTHGTFLTGGSYFTLCGLDADIACSHFQTIEPENVVTCDHCIREYESALARWKVMRRYVPKRK